MGPTTLGAGAMLATYGWATWYSLGEYAPFPILATFCLFCLFCGLYLGHSEPPPRVPERQAEAVLAGLFLFFFGLVMKHPKLMAFTSFAAKCQFQGWLWLGLAGFGVFWLPGMQRAGFAMASLTLAAALYWVVLVDPEPNIDVWVFYQKACGHCLAGQNPYPQTYPDIYDGAYAYPPGLHYLPAALYWLLPFYFLFGDIRVGMWAAKVGSAWLLGRLAASQGLGPRIQHLAVLVWLVFPCGFRVLENAWMDTLVGFWTLAALLLWVRDRYGSASACLAVALCTKQTAVFVGFLTFAFFALHRNRRGLAGWALAVLAALLMMLPFALADWHAYWSSISEFWTEPVRLDAFSLIALAINEYGLHVESWQTLVIYAGLLPAVLWRLSRNDSWRDLWGALVLLLGSIFYFGKQAFCNYYDLLSLFLLARLLLAWGGEPAPHPENPAQV